MLFPRKPRADTNTWQMLRVEGISEKHTGTNLIDDS